MNEGPLKRGLFQSESSLPITIFFGEMPVFRGVDGLLVGWRRIMLSQNQLWQRSTIKWLSTKQNHWVHTNMCIHIHYIHTHTNASPTRRQFKGYWNTHDWKMRQLRQQWNLSKGEAYFLYQTWHPCEWFCKFGRLFWLFALYLFHKIPQQKTGNIIHSSGIDVHPGLNASAFLFDHLDLMFIQFSCNKKQLKIHNSYRKKTQAKLPWLFLWTLSIIIHLNFSTKKHLGVYVLQKIPVASCKFRFVGKSCT